MEAREAAFIAMMDAAEMYTLKRQALEASLKKGIFNISQARYAMGGRALGQTQYDMESMLASVHVLLEPGQGLEHAPVSMKLMMEEPCSANSSRPQQLGSGPQTHPKAREGSPEQEGEGPCQGKDPLRWFGVLVPPALRAAQAEFRA
ncbi:coiled-coil domain containing 115, partial [Haematococcus lacustris]